MTHEALESNQSLEEKIRYCNRRQEVLNIIKAKTNIFSEQGYLMNATRIYNYILYFAKLHGTGRNTLGENNYFFRSDSMTISFNLSTESFIFYIEINTCNNKTELNDQVICTLNLPQKITILIPKKIIENIV